MMWKWKRPAAFLLAAAMIFTMPGIPAFAVETDVSVSYTHLDVYKRQLMGNQGGKALKWLPRPFQF